MKREVILLLIGIFLCSLVLAQNKIDITATKDKFKPGENITFIAYLYDSSNNPINDKISVSVESPEKNQISVGDFQSNKQMQFNLGEKPSSGYWKIIVSYQEQQANSLFFIEENQLARFELNGENLTITNIGNSRYSKEVNIIIGGSIGKKLVELDMGESARFRLIAPDGTYKITINDGVSEPLIKGDIQLTGNVIGIRELALGGSLTRITGGLSPNDSSSWQKMKSVYIFLAALLGLAVLLVVERNYRRKLGK